MKLEVAEAVSAFREFSIKAKTKVEKTVLNGALMVERDAKLLFKGRDAESVPNEPPRVQTGRARASITHRLLKDADGVSAEIGTNVEYAYDLEHGTSKTYPHPFMAPALAQNENEVEKAIAEAVEEAMRA